MTLPEQYESFSEARRNGFISVMNMKKEGKIYCRRILRVYAELKFLMRLVLPQLASCGRARDYSRAEQVLPAISAVDQVKFWFCSHQ